MHISELVRLTYSGGIFVDDLQCCRLDVVALYNCTCKHLIRAMRTHARFTWVQQLLKTFKRQITHRINSQPSRNWVCWQLLPHSHFKMSDVLVLIVAIRPTLDFQQIIWPPVVHMDMDNSFAWDTCTPVLNFAGTVCKTDYNRNCSKYQWTLPSLDKAHTSLYIDFVSIQMFDRRIN